MFSLYPLFCFKLHFFFIPFLAWSWHCRVGGDERHKREEPVERLWRENHILRTLALSWVCQARRQTEKSPAEFSKKPDTKPICKQAGWGVRVATLWLRPSLTFSSYTVVGACPTVLTLTHMPNPAHTHTHAPSMHSPLFFFSAPQSSFQKLCSV